MARLHLLFTMAGVTAAVAAVARTSPERASPTLRAASVAPGTARGVPVGGEADQIAWLAGFGTYNVRRGTWNFVPNPRGC